MKMRPMSLFERGWSTGEVSLAALLNGNVPSPENVLFEFGEFAEVDLSKVSEKRRDPYKAMRSLQSIARNISTGVTLSALSKDTRGSDGGLDDETVADYLDALVRLMSVENLPGLEIDAIAENADGTWRAFEIKLGIGAANTSMSPMHTPSMKSE